MKKIEEAVRAFMDNEDIDEGNENIRLAVTTVDELRFAIACARSGYESSEIEELIDALISL